MTGIRILLAALLCGGAGFVCAKQPPANKVITREVAFDECHFKMRDAYGGTLSATKYSTPTAANYDAALNPKARHPFETWIQFSCEDPATPKTYLDRSMSLTAQGWKLNNSQWDSGAPGVHTTLYLLHGKGWEGAGTTQDNTDGDERRRTREFSFCIPHKQLALCGSIQNVGYLMWPKESTLPQVIKLLESIEFIDTPVPAPASASSTP